MLLFVSYGKSFNNVLHEYDQEPLVHRIMSFHFIKDLFASFHMFSLSLETNSSKAFYIRLQ